MLREGKRLHTCILASEHRRNVYLSNLLIQMYGKCGSLENARMVFDSISRPNMFSAYAQNRDMEEAKSMFDMIPVWCCGIAWLQRTLRMGTSGRQRKCLTACLNEMLSGIAQAGSGVMEHFAHGVCPERAAGRSQADVQSDATGGYHLTDCHGCCISPRWALKSMFDSMPERNVVTSTAMIQIYAENGHPAQAKNMFDKLPEVNMVSCTAMIQAYAISGRFEDADRIFLEMLKRNLISWSTLLVGYAQNMQLEEAKNTFDRMPEHNMVSWTAMFQSYVQSGYLDQASLLFEWNTLLAVYAMLGHLVELKSVFDRMPQWDVVSFNTVVAVYAQKFQLEEAKQRFDRMPERDAVSWNIMISAYAQNGHLEEARNTSPEQSWSNIIAA